MREQEKGALMTRSPHLRLLHAQIAVNLNFRTDFAEDVELTRVGQLSNWTMN